MCSENDPNGCQNQEAMYQESFVKIGKPRRGILGNFTKWLRFENLSHKQNFIQTFCVYLNFVLLGWNYGQLGTAFQDLQLVLKTNVKQTSLIFTMNSVGYMVGSVSIGFVYDRMDKLLLLGVVAVMSAVASAVIPWCTSYGPFLALRLLTGFLCGGLDSGGNAKVASCWNTDGAKYMQALHFSYAFGGIISPLVTSLFMAPRALVSTAHNQTRNITFIQENSYIHINLSNTTVNSEKLSTVTTDDTMTEIYGETNIHIAFLITGVLTALAGCFYLLLYWRGYEKVRPFTKGVQARSDTEYKSRTDEQIKYIKMSKRDSILSIIVLALSVILFSAVECKFQSFLMPFMLMQLYWPKKQIAFMISLLWGFYGLGRFVGITISRYFSPCSMLVSFMLLTLVLSCAILIGSVYKIDTLMWIVVPLSGLAISIIFPSFIVWTYENVRPITGKMAGYFLFVGALGFLIDPLYVGVLVENVSPLCFVYLQIGEISCSLVFYVLLIVWVSNLKKRDRSNAAHSSIYRRTKS